MSGLERGVRMRLATAARRLHASGLNPGMSGNLSARVESGYIVTPSGAAYETL
ncbi:MAG: class II aldolase/adducin family protein, partial [Usitatibacter sp.]